MSICSRVEAFMIPASNLFVPQALKVVGVKHENREFFVIDSRRLQFIVQRGDLSEELRGISRETLEKMMQAGYLSVRKVGEDYALQFQGRLLGAGPLTAAGAYLGMNIAGGVVWVAGKVTEKMGGAPLVLMGASLIKAAPDVAKNCMWSGPF